MVKKKSNRKPKNIGEAVGFRNVFSNEKTDFLLGVILLLVAIFVVIAMVSFFSTGQADQSLLESLRPGEWMNTNRIFTNYCGSIGAIMSYFFMAVNFGIPAFFIPIFVVLVGVKLM
ncbi:MAG: DNA translocase FtsK 4TM domain-containing protein, partial [Prevotella salivae]|nr:DNA translocase FtsK 4TM domain-containing protein [Segatella salivae]